MEFDSSEKCELAAYGVDLIDFGDVHELVLAQSGKVVVLLMCVGAFSSSSALSDTSDGDSPVPGRIVCVCWLCRGAQGLSLSKETTG